jgi:hypothetical protein
MRTNPTMAKSRRSSFDFDVLATPKQVCENHVMVRAVTWETPFSGWREVDIALTSSRLEFVISTEVRGTDSYLLSFDHLVRLKIEDEMYSWDEQDDYPWALMVGSSSWELFETPWLDLVNLGYEGLNEALSGTPTLRHFLIRGRFFNLQIVGGNPGVRIEEPRT